ncbi:hypothetical protein HNV11_14825 [Spirosoma taeanense]|uniref:Uncharacterized protein n=1 Tax=Spirosoma taeanense TaxID=2735870 RepID=A0A6M5YCC1_9BACT|nr:hypothetical protein [Spirosoma taeanense]QJW90562.1 hypothetical protein HNV11_14825 [Spirosoma taeanense]
MSRLLIEINSEENEAILLSLLPKLDGRLIEKKPSPEKPSLASVLETIIQSGGAGDSFGDPSEWQREIRSWDRILDGREE